MIKKILISGMLTFSVVSYAQDMPDMNVLFGKLQKHMDVLSYVNAPIVNQKALTSSDMELFVNNVQKNKSQLKKDAKSLKHGFTKASKVVKKGSTFNAFAEKAIELSGYKESLDETAKEMGYKNALELTLLTTRITRAMVSIEMDKHSSLLSAVPEGNQDMIKGMLSNLLGSASNADVEVVKPYAKELKHLK